MLKKLLTFITLTLSISGLLMATSIATVSADANKDAVCEGIGLTGGSCDPATTGSGGITDTVKLVINILSLLVGVAAVIMIIVGGFKYVISQGEGSNTASAKNTILYAIVGLVVVALAQVIVRFVINKTPNPPCPTGQTRQADGSCA